MHKHTSTTWFTIHTKCIHKALLLNPHGGLNVPCRYWAIMTSQTYDVTAAAHLWDDVLFELILEEWRRRQVGRQVEKRHLLHHLLVPGDVINVISVTSSVLCKWRHQRHQCDVISVMYDAISDDSIWWWDHNLHLFIIQSSFIISSAFARS